MREHFKEKKKTMNRKQVAAALMLMSAASLANAQRATENNDTTIAKRYELGEVQVSASRNNAKVKEIPASISVIDHPINIYHPEGEYLKGLVLYVE